MASLLLHNVGGGWEIRVANTDQVIALRLGEQGVDEAASVRNLAQAMSRGANQVVADAEYIFENAPQVDAQFVQTLFGGADELFMEEVVVFASKATLFEEITEAGEALLALV